MLLVVRSSTRSLTGWLSQAAKGSKSEAQLEKERQRKEHQQKILAEVGGKTNDATSPSRKAGPSERGQAPSLFQRSLVQRIDNFCIDFRFRNTAPRPPVGPCFVGQTLDHLIQERAAHHESTNDVESNYAWKLHTEPVSVPLAPYLLQRNAYEKSNAATAPASSFSEEVHPEDLALIDWKGNLGDSSLEQKKLRQDEARARAKAILSGKPLRKLPQKVATIRKKNHKTSRVLTEGMQTWMKKTTYLSNDYTRKVHDFKSQAQTQQELAAELRLKQEEIAQHRTAESILANFDATPVHPYKKNLEPKKVYEILPNVATWGTPLTHVMIDKPPAARDYSMNDLNHHAIISDVEKESANSRMKCQLLVPPEYKSVSTYDLDVEPLKHEDSPATFFTIWLDEEESKAYYLPLASRVKLSSGRPPRSTYPRTIERREKTPDEIEHEERLQAEVDEEMAAKYPSTADAPARSTGGDISAASENEPMAIDENEEDHDDGEGDFGDDSDSDSGDEHLFGGSKPVGTAVNVN